LPADAGLQLAGLPIDSAVLVREGAIPTYARVQGDDGTRVTVGTRCAELQVLARGQARTVEDLDAAIAEREAILAGMEAERGTWAFEAGAEVFWDDGERAGQLVAPHAFDREPRLDSDRRCFAYAGLTLCVRADDMKELR
jgi:hypothetical protein